LNGLAEKAMDGAGVKALARWAEGNPEEAKLRRGASIAQANPRCEATDSGAEQDPGDGAVFLEWFAKASHRKCGETARGYRPSTRWRGFAGGKTPEERIPDVAAE